MQVRHTVCHRLNTRYKNVTPSLVDNYKVATFKPPPTSPKPLPGLQLYYKVASSEATPVRSQLSAPHAF